MMSEELLHKRFLDGCHKRIAELEAELAESRARWERIVELEAELAKAEDRADDLANQLIEAMEQIDLAREGE